MIKRGDRRLVLPRFWSKNKIILIILVSLGIGMFFLPKDSYGEEIESLSDIFNNQVSSNQWVKYFQGTAHSDNEIRGHTRKVLPNMHPFVIDGLPGNMHEQQVAIPLNEMSSISLPDLGHIVQHMEMSIPVDSVGFFGEINKYFDDVSSGQSPLINQCVASQSGVNADICQRWLATGYKFILYSAAGVMYKGVEPNQDQKYQDFVNAGGFATYGKTLTVQMMDDNGNIINTNGKTVNVGRINSSFDKASGEDVIGTTFKIHKSLVVAMWQDGIDEPVWVLRLICANPIAMKSRVDKKENCGPTECTTPDKTPGGNSCAQDAYAKVSTPQAKVDLPTNGKAKVTFNYTLTKQVTGTAAGVNTDVDYFITSKADLSPDGTRIFSNKIIPTEATQGTKLGNFASTEVGAVVRNVKTTAGSDIPLTTTNYTEEVEITWDNSDENTSTKGVVWHKIDSTKGYICRVVDVNPGSGNTMSNKDVCIDKNSTDGKADPKTIPTCVEINTGGTLFEAEGGLYVNDITPEIAPISTTINQLYKGINSYAYRPKQWSKQEKSFHHKTGRYSSEDSAEDALKNKLERDCTQLCSKDLENKIKCNSGDYPIEFSNIHVEEHEHSYECNCSESCDDFGCDTDCDTCYWYDYDATGDAKCTYLQREEGAQWHITKFIVRPETSTPENIMMSPASGTNEDPCTYYRNQAAAQGANANGGFQCDTYRQGNHAFDSASVYSMKNGHVSPSSNNTNRIVTEWNTKVFTNISPSSGGINANVKSALNAGGDAPYTVESLPTGSKVCFGVSMNPWIDCGGGNNCPNGITKTGEWRHSAPKCFIVSKKPYFSVENGMVVTSGGISTSINLRDKTKAGSWSEYAAIAKGKVSSNFATNAASFGGTTEPNSQWNYLTFANKPNNGNFTANPTNELINPVSFFRSAAGSDDGDEVSYANTTIFRHKSDTEIDSSLEPGVHYYDKDVTITEDLTDSDQIVIVAKGNLTIQSDVSKVRAWLIVRGTLYTSDKAVSDGNILDNEVQLTIYGPVRAKSIKFRRTYGSGVKADNLDIINPNHDQFEEAAEQFIDTAGTYVWSYYNSVDKGRIQTVYLREVAPRY